MATKKESEDLSDILTCTICLEIFKNPKYLPCLHTFCETCLQTYIASSVEKGQKSSFQCPVCRSEVTAPSESCTAESWTEIIPANFLISSLVENRKLTRSEMLCMMCERSGSENVSKATLFCLQCTDALCDTCEKFHSSMKITTGHIVKPIQSISRENLFPDFRNNCEIHHDEILKLYCLDHKVPCCHTCVSISHRKCEDVTTLQEAAKGIKESSVIKEITKELNQAGEDVDSFMKRHKNAMSELDEVYNEHFKSIENNFTEMKKIIVKHETSRKSQLEKIYNDIKHRRETAFVVMENRRMAIQKDKKMLEACLKNTSDMQVMIEASKFEKTLERFKKKEASLIETDRPFNENISLSKFEVNDLEEKIRDAFVVTTKRNTSDSRTCTICRFPLIGDEGGYRWKVNSSTDAILFSASAPISLLGVLSYGCRNVTDKCFIDMTILKQSGRVMRRISTALSTNPKDYKKNITEIYLDKPLEILEDTLYEVSFVMKSDALCTYGDKGLSSIELEGIRFSFVDSKKSNNGTTTKSGQIPGFVFQRM